LCSLEFVSALGTTKRSGLPELTQRLAAIMLGTAMAQRMAKTLSGTFLKQTWDLRNPGTQHFAMVKLSEALTARQSWSTVVAEGRGHAKSGIP